MQISEVYIPSLPPFLSLSLSPLPPSLPLPFSLALFMVSVTKEGREGEKIQTDFLEHPLNT